MSTMSIFDWLHVLCLGAVVGAFGQGARVIVGLKKLNDAALSQATIDHLAAAPELIEWERVAMSLALGAIAGALAAAMTITSGNMHAIPGAALAGIAAAGYSGADFIEGVMSRVRPTKRSLDVRDSPSLDGPAIRRQGSSQTPLTEHEASSLRDDHLDSSAVEIRQK